MDHISQSGKHVPSMRLPRKPSTARKSPPQSGGVASVGGSFRRLSNFLRPRRSALRLPHPVRSVAQRVGFARVRRLLAALLSLAAGVALWLDWRRERLLPDAVARLLSLPAVAIRGAAPPTAAICCIVRNEEAYLHEWIDYHLGLGFDHVYVYDNSDGYDLRNWRHRDTTVTHFTGQGVQPEAYLDCARRFGVPRRHRWIAFFDADEFLVLFRHRQVTDFLKDHCRRGAVSLNWRIMSWSNQSQYSPLPVAKRFPYRTVDHRNVSVHFLVKTVVYLPDMDLRQLPHAHFPYLKAGRWRVDTRRRRIRGPDPWVNQARPAQVALLYHYATKSWREYIAKRTRGRAGTKDVSGIPALIRQARDGFGLERPAARDDAVWHRFRETSPQYRMFDMDLGAVAAHIAAVPRDVSSTSAICTRLTANDEFYVDEWVDYHLALGFTRIYLYDPSEEEWMAQWGEERATRSQGRVLVIPCKSVALGTTIEQDCRRRFDEAFRDQQNRRVLFMKTNEFLMLRKDLTIQEFLQHYGTSTAGCTLKLPIIQFGTSFQDVYEPLPVTKRFTRRVEDLPLRYKSIVLMKMTTTRTNQTISRSLNQYLPSSSPPRTKANGDCPSTVISDTAAAIYQYTRSRKECRVVVDSNDNTTCSISGSVVDTSAWIQVTKYLPNYGGYDKVLW